MTEFPFRKISDLYHEDAGFRAAAETDARAALAGEGVRIGGPGEVRLAANTEDTVHVVFPPDPNAAVPDGALDGVAGGVRFAASEAYAIASWSNLGLHRRP